MSGYPSLISPLMDAQGLILTEALNTDAQTALALSATNQADIVVLQETSLQLQGDPATYTGLPETDLSLNGNLKMNNYDIENVNEITSSNVNCNNILNIGGYAISGIPTGVNIDANIITPLDITCGTLNYTELNPPISGGSQNIEQVLITGSNANGQSLTGLTNLSSVNVQSTNAGTTAVLKANNIGLYNDNGTTLKAVLDPSGNFFAQNYYLYGRSPSDFSITNNKNILTTGNITSNNITTQSVETPALTSSAGFIYSPSIVMPTGSLSAKNNSGNGFIETNEMRVYRDGGNYSGYFNNQGTCFMSRYQLFDVPEETFNIALDGSAQFTNIVNNGTLNTTKIELAETLQDASSSVGTAGQVLSSTGTGTQWITPSSGGTPSLSDVMTVGNTASTILDMNNNTVDNAFSVNTKTLYSVDNVEGGNIYSNNLTIQDGTGTPQLTITPVGDISTSGTIQSADITVGTTSGQQVILSNIGGVRCSSLNIPSDALTPAFSITNDGIAFTTKLEIGETLADASNSVGTAGQLLSSTGTATAWVDAPSSNPTLGDVMTNGNTASADLNMNNNDITSAASLSLTGGATTITQTVNPANQTLEIKNGANFAKVFCDRMSSSFVNTVNLTTDNIRLFQTLQDGDDAVGTAGQVLSSTGAATRWITPSSGIQNLSQVLSTGNSAGSSNINMNTQNIYGVLNFELTNGGSSNISQRIVNGDTLEIMSSFPNLANVQCNTVDANNIDNAGYYKDASASNGTAGQLLSSTGTATAWVDAPVSATPSLADVMTVGNVASADLNMNSNNITAAGNITSGSVSSINASSNGFIEANEMRIYQDDVTYAGYINNQGTSYMSRYQLLDVPEETFNIAIDGSAQFTDIACNLVNGTDINFRPSYDYFVAKNGNDDNPGSILSPFLTIQKAIDICESFTDNVPRNVNIFYGSYSENLTISKSRIAFNGSNMAGSRSDTGCSINGSITIDVSSGLSDMNNNNIYFNNLLINGSISDSSSVVHRVGIKNCYLYADSTALSFAPSVDYRLFVDYSYINNEDINSSDPLVSCGGSGMVSFSQNQITQKGKGHVVSIQDSCRIDLFSLNALTNDNISNECLAICKLGSSVDNAAYALGQNVFAYSSTTPKSSEAPFFSCGILMDVPATKTNFLTIINNTFVMTGLANTAGNFAVTGTLNASSTVFVFYGNNVGVSTTSFNAFTYHINSTSGFNKIPLQSIQ